jgi:DNA repair protein RadC
MYCDWVLFLHNCAGACRGDIVKQSPAMRKNSEASPGTFNYEIQVFKMIMVRDSSMCISDIAISSPPAAHIVVDGFLKGADREHLIVLMLDVKHQFIGIHTASIGDLCSAIANPREIFKAAILSNAHSIILAHNHPSGDPTPSPEDVEVTKKIAKAGAVLRIPLRDHIIVGSEGRYTSLKESGAF